MSIVSRHHYLFVTIGISALLFFIYVGYIGTYSVLDPSANKKFNLYIQRQWYRKYNESSRNNCLNRFDFDAPCDVKRVNEVLFNPLKPLTHDDVDLLRGCIVLLFLRTPRSGTTAIHTLFDIVADRNCFESRMGPLYRCRPGPGLEYRINYIENRTRNREPVVVTEHNHATDFISPVSKPPVIFNVIREPISHAISIFKMHKYGDRPSQYSNMNKPKEFCNLTLNDYILGDNFLTDQCIAHGYLGLQYLSGACRGCTRMDLLEQAKRNLDDIYLLVGYSENIPAFVNILETLLPQFFEGALKSYLALPGLYTFGSPDPSREEELSEEASEKMMEVLAPDIELYRYVKNRFHLAARKILEYKHIKDMR